MLMFVVKQRVALVCQRQLILAASSIANQKRKLSVELIK